MEVAGCYEHRARELEPCYCFGGGKWRCFSGTSLSTKLCLFLRSIVEASISDLWPVPFGRDVSDRGTSWVVRQPRFFFSCTLRRQDWMSPQQKPDMVEMWQGLQTLGQQPLRSGEDSSCLRGLDPRQSPSTPAPSYYASIDASSIVTSTCDLSDLPTKSHSRLDPKNLTIDEDEPVALSTSCELQNKKTTSVHQMNERSIAVSL